jgi:hypothetical protein
MGMTPIAGCISFPRADVINKAMSLKAMIGRWMFWLSVATCAASAALAPSAAMAAGGIPENAANGDPCGGIRPCDLGGNFTINEMLQQRPYPIRGVCESRCFWQAVVTNSCFFPDAIIDIHAPVNASTGQLNKIAADILISETKSPGVQRYLKDSGAGYRVSFTRLTGQDLIDMGAPACR